MKTLKMIGLTIVQFIKEILLLPKTLANAASDRRKKAAWNESNAERLDRIRNPSKYLGK